MDEQTIDIDGRVTAGRKGVPYDWQTVLALDEAARAAETRATTDVLVAL